VPGTAASVRRPTAEDTHLEEAVMVEEAKTKPTDASVDDYIARIEDSQRADDCRALVKLMTRLTKKKPVMWGPSIVGFDSYHYRYDSGREGDACLMGFSSRKADIAIYVVAGFDGTERLLGVWAAEGFQATHGGRQAGGVGVRSREQSPEASASGRDDVSSIQGRPDGDYAGCMAAIRRRLSARHTSFHSAWTRCSPLRLN
jgi:hypothetical protein